MSWKLTRKASYTNQNEGCTPCKEIIELRETLGNYVNVITGAHNLRINNVEKTLGNHQEILDSNNLQSGDDNCVTCDRKGFNTSVGNQALQNTTGSYNTAVGTTALYYNTTGQLNTAVGYNALKDSLGDNNTAVGTTALRNATGTQNTALGTTAGFNLATGDNNVLIGYNAQASTNGANGEIVIGSTASGNGNDTATIGNTAMTGFYVGAGNGKLVAIDSNKSNTAVGTTALFYNTTGTQNTAMGFSALKSTTSGSGNTALGYGAGLNSISGDYNVYLGSGVSALDPSANNEIVIGANTIGNGTNTATIGNIDITGFYVGDGDGRLVAIDSSNSNTAVGYEALVNTTSGIDNTAVGTGALYFSTSGSNNTAVGTGALFSTTSGSNNTAFGEEALLNTTSGTYNTALGKSAGFNLATGDNNVFIGYNAEPSIANASNEIVIGADASGNGNNTATIGNTAMTGFYVGAGQNKLVEINGSTNEIVIGTGASGNGSNTTTIGTLNTTTMTYIDSSLNVAGSITYSGTITQTSDERVKRDIQPTALGLDFIDKLSPVRYRRVNPADYPEPLLDSKFKGDDPAPRPPDDDTAYDGLIAQEVEAAIKDLGVEWSGHDVDAATGKQGLQYGLLVVPLINAVKELKAKDEIIMREIDELKKRIA